MRIFIMRAPELTPAAVAAAVVLIHSISAQWRERERGVCSHEREGASERDRVPIFESKQPSLARSLSVSLRKQSSESTLSSLFFACLGERERERALLVVQIRNQGRKGRRKEGRKHYMIIFCLLSPSTICSLAIPTDKEVECFQALSQAFCWK